MNIIEITRCVNACGLSYIRPGITSVGHRRRLLDAVAKLHDDSASSQAAEPSGDHLESTPAENVVSSGGERRQLTVMFCDLVGSTAL
jgi:class 3 adenylate cyclase